LAQSVSIFAVILIFFFCFEGLKKKDAFAISEYLTIVSAKRFVTLNFYQDYPVSYRGFHQDSKFPVRSS
jgi:hypothetical protein